ncbi:hypothetical protein DM860_010163 [Cuscuta australis]|uniref:Uncharacterized protein n=1 Tax=Cuscuta australis TaxID=267555 RepID=A0A328DAK9_9ASTE|nr:hypothetical protein DM860_010163 [Cuscuta australis]
MGMFGRVREGKPCPSPPLKICFEPNRLTVKNHFSSTPTKHGQFNFSISFSLILVLMDNLVSVHKKRHTWDYMMCEFCSFFCLNCYFFSKIKVEHLGKEHISTLKCKNDTFLEYVLIHSFLALGFVW